MSTLARPLEERFWEKVDVRGGNECWEWRGARMPWGYGRLRVGNKKCDYAHRVSYRLAFGGIPLGMFVCHRCDNPPCVNPQHLFVGTNLENRRDSVVKRRNRSPFPLRGEANHAAKLTVAQVLEIRAAPGRPADIAARYGINWRTVSRIRRREYWSHV